MSVRIIVSISKEVSDIDQANDFVDEVREELVGKITATLHSSITNHNPREELTKEQESE